MKEHRILMHSGLIYHKRGVDHIFCMISPNSLFWQQIKRFMVVTFVIQIGGNLCFETVIYFGFSVQSQIIFCHESPEV